MQASKLSSKSHVSLPEQVREALGARPADSIAYEIEGEVVRLKRLDPFDAAFHKTLSQTLSEWASDEDEEVFRDL